MSDDLAKLLKVNAIKLKGTVNETFTNMSMQAALDLNIPMGDNITMKEVVFGTRLGTINPIEFSIGGKIEAKIGEDLVGFNASFAFAPIDQKISGEFFYGGFAKRMPPWWPVIWGLMGNPIYRNGQTPLVFPELG